MVGHAPVQDEHGRQEKWWKEITAMIQWRPQPRAELVALIDANGRVDSIASQAVGPVEPQEEDAGRELLHDFLGKCGLLAANTFDGTGRRTWVPTGGTAILWSVRSAGSRCCSERERLTFRWPSRTRKTTDQSLRSSSCVMMVE